VNKRQEYEGSQMMMFFNVKIKFIHKGSINKKVECNDSFTAIHKALETLNLTEKNNIKAVLVTNTSNLD
jgi:hypothetical protein